ncbi:bacteriophage abortive infection AbiH family protein [Bacteroides sp.]|uniref:bacteriophage abortive infection AbiH family protein n=1 Tax=Bacteroides sp. TaxID=29523 RepID=UPI003AB7568D
MKNLYIIGNGFDCHHGIYSSYKAYREWLKENNSELYEKLSDFYATEDDEWWWQFELNLGEINLTDYISLTSLENQPDLTSEEFRSRDYNAGSYQAENDIGGLVSDIKGTFKKWIESLSQANTDKKIELIHDDCFFINFNYTHTLQQLYGIPDSQILHIHGDIGEEELILGHNKTYEELHAMAEGIQPEPPEDLSEDELAEWYQDNGDDYITQTVRDTAVNNIFGIRKDVENIINNNHLHFSSMKDIEHIYIYGFSFSPVDIPYIDEILRYIDKNKVQWTISYFSKDDIDKIESYMNSKDIPSTLWQPLIRLEDIQVLKQLKIFK